MQYIDAVVSIFEERLWKLNGSKPNSYAGHYVTGETMTVAVKEFEDYFGAKPFLDRFVPMNKTVAQYKKDNPISYEWLST